LIDEGLSAPVAHSLLPVLTPLPLWPLVT